MPSHNNIDFPSDFRFGVAQTAFQFEMGDKHLRYIDSNSDWWIWTRDPVNIARKIISGDLPENGANYLEMYKIDHENAQKLGLNIYWLELAWSRIFPHPTWFIEVDVEHDSYGLVKDVKITEETLRELDKIADHNAIRLYRDILLDLRAHGIKPIICINHWVMPFWLHDPIKSRDTHLSEGPLGLLEDMYPVELTKFAAYLAWKFGDLVDTWYTFNEPMVPITAGYVNPSSGFPPGVLALDKLPKLITNTVIAHGLAYNLVKKYDTVKADEDSKEPAEVGIVYNIAAVYPLNPSDESAAENLSYFYNEIILNAITKGVLDVGLNKKDLIKPSILGNKLDWIGVNYYTRSVVKKIESKTREIHNFQIIPGYGYACIPNSVSKIGRWCADNGWEFYPEGIAKAVEIASKYSNRIYITENGVADARDVYRPQHLVNTLYVLNILAERGINLLGYMHWALVDNYEWAQGFRMRFGLYEVDYNTKERKPRKSTHIYSEIAKTKKISKEYLDKYLIQMEKF